MNFIAKWPIILASQSPRRQELLESLGIEFTARPSNIDEHIEWAEENFNDYAQKLAAKKAGVIQTAERETIIIAADTIVVFKGMLYHKPASVEQAESYLRKLSGNTHSVITGVCIRTHEKDITFSVETKVSFKELDDELIRAYAASGDPMDKAGGYGIQTAGALLVEKIDGDYLNVVGLPLSTLVESMRAEGLLFLKEGG